MCTFENKHLEPKWFFHQISLSVKMQLDMIYTEYKKYEIKPKVFCLPSFQLNKLHKEGQMEEQQEDPVETTLKLERIFFYDKVLKVNFEENFDWRDWQYVLGTLCLSPPHFNYPSYF